MKGNRQLLGTGVVRECHSEREILEFFRRAAVEKAEHDQCTTENIGQLRRLNAERRAADKRDLGDEYRNYIPPIV